MAFLLSVSCFSLVKFDSWIEKGMHDIRKVNEAEGPGAGRITLADLPWMLKKDRPKVIPDQGHVSPSILVAQTGPARRTLVTLSQLPRWLQSFGYSQPRDLQTPKSRTWPAFLA